MTDEPSRVVRASREIEAPAERIFELIADPARQPSWDGNDNLAEAKPGQRVHAVGEVFTTTLTNGWVRENRIVEFEEARRVAWRPSEPGKEPPGHLWRWELNPLSATRTEVTHTYDWSELDPDDTMRNTRARSMTADNLTASLENLARAAELPQS
ncbi:SRPBCC family protein [Amycolatopsis halotolerans]|uniref:SRPBCC family protein n=1 Tax=Amycolatopsis halotolerans TaxID=330083 RepID=A0ABV7QYK2_9PSEU